MAAAAAAAGMMFLVFLERYRNITTAAGVPRGREGRRPQKKKDREREKERGEEGKNYMKSSFLSVLRSDHTQAERQQPFQRRRLVAKATIRTHKHDTFTVRSCTLPGRGLDSRPPTAKAARLSEWGL